jgi:hypothetical protein
MIKALGNVAPRHLLDTRLNPPAVLRATAAGTTVRLKPDTTETDPGSVRLQGDRDPGRLLDHLRPGDGA